MSARRTALLGVLATAGLLFEATLARADQPPAGAVPPSTPGAASGAPSAPSSVPVAAPTAEQEWQPDNRIILSGDRDTLTSTNGGEGGSINYLGQPGPNALLGVGAEYQRLATANWEFASFTGAYSHAMTADSKWSVHGEAHEGAGRSSTATGSSSFDYSIVAGGAGLTVPGGFSFDLEERQIDVQSSHGSLPKVTLAQQFGKHLLTTLAYAHSVGGNLDTRYGLARVDVLGPGFGVFGGGSVGYVTPAVINIEGVLLAQAHHLSELFLGVTKPIHRVDLTLLGDNLDLEGIKRVTVTLNVTVHLR